MVSHKKLKNHKNFCHDLNVATVIGTDISCAFLEILESLHHIDRCNKLTPDYVGAMRQKRHILFSRCRLHAWGKDLKEAFEQVKIRVFFPEMN